MNPVISVITVCYNSEKTIERTLQAMLAQSFQDYEYIIIDGASTDGTIEIIKQYESRFLGKMKWYSEADNGIYDAMNKGIVKARGNLIGMVNSDDYYEPDALMNIYQAYLLEKDKPGENAEGFIFYGMQRRLRHGEEIEIEFVNHRILGESMICHPTCFVSREIYNRYGGYDTKYKSAADLDFLLRIHKQAKVLFVPVYHIISNFELGGMSSSGKGAREAAKIRYQYGVYSKMRMIYVIMQSRLMDIVHNWKRR